MWPLPISPPDKTLQNRDRQKVTPHELNKLLRCKMIPDICETNTGRNAAGSCQSTEERGLGHAETSAALEHIACAIMFGKIKRRIRIVKDVVADSKIKLHGDLDRLRTFPNDDSCA